MSFSVAAGAAPNQDEIARTVEILGGREAIPARIASTIDVHDLILGGLPAAALEHLAASAGPIIASDAAIEAVVGVSTRTFQRRMRDRAALSPEQGGRVWKFAEILGRARAILGSAEAADTWLKAPAIGLDQRRPIDLLATPVGVQAVEDYLTRIEYGVYT
jgi:putative toxin-antitoxin system antitoxin component (TIGR02293 family)